MTRALALLGALCLLGACQGENLAVDAPAGYDLTGVWVLDAAASDATPDFKRGLGGQRSGSPRTPREAQRAAIRGALGSGLAFVVHDFQVLSAERLEIEQNRDSMGVRHVPGVYRDVSWGKRQRGLWEVNAGWAEGALVIVSRAPDLRVRETMTLAGDRLRVGVEVRADDERRELVRVFRRDR